MFWPEAHPYDAGRDTAQDGKCVHESQQGRQRFLCRWTVAPGQDRTDDAVLRHDLELLRGTRGKGPAALNLGKVGLGEGLIEQRRGKQIRCGHRILDCEIDTYTSEW